MTQKYCRMSCELREEFSKIKTVYMNGGGKYGYTHEKMLTVTSKALLRYLRLTDEKSKLERYCELSPL